MRRVLFWVLLLGVLVPALLLTFTRVVEPVGGFWIRFESFTPFGMVLYLAALVLLLSAVVVNRGRGRGVASLAAVAATAGLALHVWWFAPMVSGENPAAPSGAETLRVMTVNMLVGQGGGDALMRAATEEDIDLLVVQEITGPLLAEMEAAGISTLLPNRVGEPGEGAEGTMVFARDELGAPTQLGTTWDSLRVSVGELTMLAVHPVSPLQPAGWRDDHATILAAARQPGVDLVVGDLNATIDHEPMRALVDVGFRSASELANEGWDPTWPFNGRIDMLGVPVPHMVQIDHVLVTERLAARGTHTVELPRTDHRAVVAELAVR